MGLAFYDYSLPSSSLLFLILLPSLHSLCMHVWLHKKHSWQTPGFGSAEKFYFLSLLVKQLAPWIGCVFSGNHEVHRANKPWSNFGLLFCLTCQFLYNCGRSFASNHCLRTEDFSFSDREKALEIFSTGIVGLQQAVAHMYQTDGPRSLNFKPQPTYQRWALDWTWTGSGLWRILLILDWSRTVKHFAILEQDQIWTQLMDKNCVVFVIKKFIFC